MSKAYNMHRDGVKAEGTAQGLICPRKTCNADRWVTYASKKSKGTRVRYRKCTNCGTTVTTHEVIVSVRQTRTRQHENRRKK